MNPDSQEDKIPRDIFFMCSFRRRVSEVKGGMTAEPRQELGKVKLTQKSIMNIFWKKHSLSEIFFFSFKQFVNENIFLLLNKIFRRKINVLVWFLKI